MGTCPRCMFNHPPVSFTEWAWAVRDAAGKPPAGQVAVLLILGSRVNPVTGCGWVSRERLMADLGVKKETVTRATAWALGSRLLTRLVRGHRTWHGGATDSLWALADPSRAQTSAVDSTTMQTGAVDWQAMAQTSAVDESYNGAHLRQTTALLGAPKEEPVEAIPIQTPTGSVAAHPETSADADTTAANGSRPPRRRGTRVPPDFPDQLRADPRHAEWFRRECPDVDGRYELDQFMDWWSGKAGKDATKLDWFATWRNWMRRTQRDITTGRRPPARRISTTDARVRDGLSLAEKYRAEERQQRKGLTR